MELKINVTIGVTPELSAIARGWLGQRALPATEAAEPKRDRTAVNDRADVKDTEVAEEKPSTVRKSAKKDTQEETPAVIEEPKTEAKASYTEEDIREAMHRCRLRIEGPDYKTDTTSPGYVKYHKALTVRFKEMAQLAGHERPSSLPAELRKDFIDRCAGIIIGDDRELTSNCPF